MFLICAVILMATEDLCGCWRKYSLPGLWQRILSPVSTKTSAPSVRHDSNTLSGPQSVGRTFSNVCVNRRMRSDKLLLRAQHWHLRTNVSRQGKCVSVGVSCETDTFKCRQFDTLFPSDSVYNTVRCIIQFVVYC